MKRSERLRHSAFGHLLGAIAAAGVSGNALIWAVALELSNHYLLGPLLAAVAAVLLVFSLRLAMDMARLWKAAKLERAIERRVGIRPKI
jgi:phosphate/sulfate permease